MVRWFASDRWHSPRMRRADTHRVARAGPGARARVNAASADGFLYTSSRSYPGGLQDFERGFSTLSSLPCDILLTPHPEASQLWERVARRDRGGAADGLVDANACRRYADAGRERLRRRIESERNGN